MQNSHPTYFRQHLAKLPVPKLQIASVTKAWL